MEFENWTVGAAMRELRANGYGYVMSSEADDYVIQFVQNYKPRTAAERAAGKATAAKARDAARQASAAGAAPR